MMFALPYVAHDVMTSPIQPTGVFSASIRIARECPESTGEVGKDIELKGEVQE